MALQTHFLALFITLILVVGGESRNLLEAPKEAPKEAPVHSETPTEPEPTVPVPKVELPPIPEIPKVVPKVELPPIPEIPKVELPPITSSIPTFVPTFPKIPIPEGIPPIPSSLPTFVPVIPKLPFPFAPPHDKESP